MLRYISIFRGNWLKGIGLGLIFALAIPLIYIGCGDGKITNPLIPPTPVPTPTFTFTPCLNSSRTPCSATPTNTPTFTPTPTFTFTLTFTPTITFTPVVYGDLDITSNTYFNYPNQYEFGYLSISNGATLFTNCSVTIVCSKYFSLNGGYLTVGDRDVVPFNLQTPWLGTPPLNSGGGGGHGGKGGNDGHGGLGGSAYDNPLNPVFVGSPGGVGDCFGYLPAPSGGLISIIVPNGAVSVHGFIEANAGSHSNYCDKTQGQGGPSGGTINIYADSIFLNNGHLSVMGGSGQNSVSPYPGGGGGGGIILLSYHSQYTSSFFDFYVDGGSATSPAQSGFPGTFNVITH